MKYESSFKSEADGLEISVMALMPDKKPYRAVVQLVHGMSEHKERYIPFMQYLAKLGYVVVIHDHRGHGKSVKHQDDLGFTYGGGAQAMLQDIRTVNRKIHAYYPELPLILMGHSMGSLAVRAFVAEHDSCVDMLIVCGSPSYNTAMPLGVAIAKTEKAVFGPRHRSKLIETMLLLVMGGLQSCTAMFGSTGTGLAATSYLSEDSDMLGAEAAYGALEADLQHELDNYESLHPGYDEYRFDLDEIKHDPYVLTSILSALHNGVFTLGEVQGDLAMLFEKQYILTQTIETETRYRTETRTDSEGNTYTVEVPYTYYICNVKLENFDLSHLPIYILTEEQMGFYAAYMQTLGNRPDLFPNGSYPHASTPKEPTYYEIPPEALKDEAFAAMIAEAEKYVGYPYVWGGSSPSTSFDCSGFISWVINHSGWNVGRQTAQGLYNICTPVSPEQAKPGDLVFFVGTYDTAGMSHVGLYVGNSVMLHCGDPISYTNLNSSYWQQHFYCYGRLP